MRVNESWLVCGGVIQLFGLRAFCWTFFWRLFDEVDGSKSNVTTVTITTKEVLCSGCLSLFLSGLQKLIKSTSLAAKRME